MACTTIAQNADTFAQENAFIKVESVVDGFTLVSYYNTVAANGNQKLHIYIEGDGRPFSSPTKIALDPTPSTPLALRLMSKDPNSSLYLGRPCYFGHSSQPPCHPAMWTQKRYSPQVVTLMQGSLIRSGFADYQERVYIGYSGGGVLAMLLAERDPRSVGVVTIAANLDIDAWTDYHAYTPLTDSLNPAKTKLKKAIQQLHLVGDKDSIVPPPITEAGLVGQPWAEIRHYEKFTHHCCWEDIWPEALSR